MCNCDQKLEISSVETVTSLDASDYFFLTSGEKVAYSVLSASLAGSAGISAYSATSNSTTAFIWATGTGVTISQNTGTGELTIAIPAGVDLKKVNLTFPNTYLASNTYYILLDYVGLRAFNISKSTLRYPIVRAAADTFSSASRTNTVLISEQGGPSSGNVISGVSSFAGGDGSDLEITIKNLNIGSNLFVTLDFA